MTDHYTIAAAYQITTSWKVKEVAVPVTGVLLDKIQRLLDAVTDGVAHFYISEDLVLQDCIVAIKPVKTSDGFIVEHWNYHPARKEIQLTHTTKPRSTLNGQCWVTQYDPEKAVIETFKSLKRLYSQD